MLLIFAAIVVIGLILWRYLTWRAEVMSQLAEGAASEWTRLSRVDPDLLKGVSETKFAEIFKKVNYPRGPDYMLGGAATLILATPVILVLLSAGVWAADLMGLIPERLNIVGTVTVEDGVVRLLDAGNEVARYWNFEALGFYLFFGLIGAWVIIASWFARRFWTRLPGDLREEIIRLR